MLLPEGSYFIIGGAGFIGSHFADALLASAKTRRVTVFDNFSSGREWHYEAHGGDPRLSVIRADASDVNALAATMEGHDWIIHLASNPNIAAAADCPEIDFYRGTLLTNNVVEAMRRSGLHRLLYASGSGVYGDAGDQPLSEDYAPLIPISTYGASKLACESLIASYCAMFGLHACAFRFGNVVGPRQTHGVGFDFLRSLSAKPKRLRILGDGHQSKPYIHVTDVVDAVLCAAKKATASCASP
jgi:UDP-glucose 4-epimerase